MNNNLVHLSADQALLVVVDVQGKLASLMYESAAVIRQIQIMVDACRLLEVPIVWAEQVPDKLGPTVPEIAQRMAGLSPTAKCTFGCCEDAVLRQQILHQRRGQIILCGIEAHVCVWQTAATLVRDGYLVHVISDAVSSRTAENKQIGLQRIAAAGGILSSVEMAVFEMLGSAQHPLFREVARLFK